MDNTDGRVLQSRWLEIPTKGVFSKLPTIHAICFIHGYNFGVRVNPFTPHQNCFPLFRMAHFTRWYTSSKTWPDSLMARMCRASGVSVTT